MHQHVADAPPNAPQPIPPLAVRLVRKALRLIAGALFIWLLVIGYIWFRQESLLFHPKPLDPDAKFDFPYTSEVYIDVPGAKLHALYLHQPPAQSRGLVLFLHGNAGNLETWFTHADFWLSTGYDVLMPDYRGFGKSSGHITSEAQLNDDVLRAWNFVAPNYVGKKRVIYGRSLGTGLAAKLATQVPSDLLVLVSPYESMTQMAQEYYPWVPSQLLRYPLNISELLPQIHSPVLLLHGTADHLISIEHSRHLLKRGHNIRLVEIPGAAHSDIQEFSQYTDTLKQGLLAL